ncbi:MAG: hypothetical protein NTW87_26630 [Planctomycetota bacterium]|nr:hypothetical protein [Planctomycetota bacterium]
MSLPPLAVQLSKFEQIEILRLEIEAREEELHQLERRIRETLFEIERQRYLQTLHPLFQQLQPPPDAAQLPQLNARRDALGEALKTMQASLAALERETAGQARPPSAPRGGPNASLSGPRRRFDSFEDFRANRPPGG